MKMTIFGPNSEKQISEDLKKIQQKGRALEFVEELIPEICLAAILKEAYALYHDEKSNS